MNTFYPYSYIRGGIVPTKEAHIPIQSKVIQYGLGLFSGIRGYWNAEQNELYLFRPQAHYERMKQGCSSLLMKWNWTEKNFLNLLKDLVKKNNCRENIYIRTLVYNSALALTPKLGDGTEDFALYMMPLKDYVDTDAGLKTCVSSWVRLEDNMIPVKTKATGSYLNSALAKTEALKHGYDEAIFLNSRGQVAEGSAENIFGIKNDVVYTPPLSADVLEGITRDSVMTLIHQELGLKVKEEAFDRSALYRFDEMFLTGTAAKVAWVHSVDGRQIGSGKIGPVTKKIKDLFAQLTQGKLSKYKAWLTPVY